MFVSLFLCIDFSLFSFHIFTHIFSHYFFFFFFFFLFTQILTYFKKNFFYFFFFFFFFFFCCTLMWTDVKNTVYFQLCTSEFLEVGKTTASVDRASALLCSVTGPRGGGSTLQVCLYRCTAGAGRDGVDPPWRSPCLGSLLVLGVAGVAPPCRSVFTDSPLVLEEAGAAP